MPSNHIFTSALALLASLSAPALAQYSATCHYFVMYTGGSLVLERVDPLLSPGVASNHVHSITGGNGFNANLDFAGTQASTCTTMPVTQDKSNYWMPTLYFQNNGEFTRVPEAYNRKIYYKYGSSTCAFDDRTAFPPGFQMMTGSATQRVENETMMGTAGNQMEWVCHDGSSNPPKGTGFPTGFQSCNDPDVPGLAASMRFPSCWNGQNFSAADPMAHMAFPTNADGMAGCPAPYNVARFPEIFIEYYLDVSQFDNITKDYSDPNNPPWVLADGDPTGYSFHMDFVSGWEPSVLQQAMQSCAISDGGSDVGVGLGSSECFGSGYQSSTVQNECRLQSIVTPSENVGVTGTAAEGEAGGVVGSALPGCNPIQTAQPAVIHDPSTCGAATAVKGGSPPAASAPAASAPAASSPAAGSTSGTETEESVVAAPVVTSTSSGAAPAPSSSSSGDSTSTRASPSSISVKNASGSTKTWTYQGCYSDLTPNMNVRSIANWGNGDSSTLCANNCYSAGYSISGTEYGSQCFCGNTITSSTKEADSDCNMACTGASSETCGGSKRLSVYAQSGTSLTKSKRSAHLHRHAAHHGSF